MAEEQQPTAEPRPAPPAPARPPKPEPPPAEPAGFPRGFWRQVDYMLHHPDSIVESLRRGENLAPIGRTLFAISLVMAALYGAVMGSTNLLQGSPLAMNHKFAMIGITMVKVPVLFVLTLAIILPPVYVSNAFTGARMSFGSLVCMLLASLAVTSTLLASMATVALFFSLTSRTYDFIKLLHILFFAYAGLSGINYLYTAARRISSRSARRTPAQLLLLWLFLYGFVGTQLAWVLRPFVSSPGEPFQVFRPRKGNFYESVAFSLGRVLGDEDVNRNQ